MRKSHTCTACNGDGEIEEFVCISVFEISARHTNWDELLEIQADAKKAKVDHDRLCKLNPKAHDSYDRQIAETLAKLNAEADALQ